MQPEESSTPIFEFSKSDMERAYDAFELFIQDFDLPREMMRIKSSVLAEQLQERGLTLALALELIQDLVAKKVFITGRELTTLRTFVPLSGGPMTVDELGRFSYLYFTRRRLRDCFAERRRSAAVEISQHREVSDVKYEFRKCDDFWILRFDGQSALIKNSVGLAYLQRLLQKPHHSIPATWLYAGLNDLAETAIGRASGEELDTQAVSNYKSRYAELEAELEQAVKDCDLGRQEPIQVEMDHIASEILRSTGAFGKSRDRSDIEKIRKSVSAAIKRAVEGIGQKHEKFGSHLRNAISTGKFPRYSPDTAPDWVV